MEVIKWVILYFYARNLAKLSVIFSSVMIIRIDDKIVSASNTNIIIRRYNWQVIKHER